MLLQQLEWHESEDDDDDDDDEDDSDNSDNSDAEIQEPEGVEDVPAAEDEDEEMPAISDMALDEGNVPEDLKKELEHKLALRREATAFMGVSMSEDRPENDVLSTPAPGEVLRTFYARTKHYWASLAHEESQGASRGKQLRRDGFDVRGTADPSWLKSATMNINRSWRRYAYMTHYRSSAFGRMPVLTRARWKTRQCGAPWAQARRVGTVGRVASTW